MALDRFPRQEQDTDRLQTAQHKHIQGRQHKHHQQAAAQSKKAEQKLDAPVETELDQVQQSLLQHSQSR